MDQEIISTVKEGLDGFKRHYDREISNLEREQRTLREVVMDVAQKSAPGYSAGVQHTGPAAAGLSAGGGFGYSLATKMQQDPALKAWAEGNRLAGRVSFDIDVRQAMQQKAVIVNSGNEQVPYERNPGIVPLATRRRWLWEYFTVANTSAPGVEYLQETGAIREAGIQSSEGALKEESVFTFDLKLATVETFAHWVALSRQVYADSPQLATFLQNRLMEGCWRKMEDSMINGDGTSPNFSGLTDAGNHVVYSGPSSTFTPLDTLRDAMAVLQNGDYAPDLMLLNPLDFADMERERDNEGSFVWANPATAAAPALWGATVHISTNVQQGKFILMDSSAAQVWMRQGAQVLLSDSHDQNFVKNVLVALCETRAAFGVLRPEAVIYGDLT